MSELKMVFTGRPAGNVSFLNGNPDEVLLNRIKIASEHGFNMFNHLKLPFGNGFAPKFSQTCEVLVINEKNAGLYGSRGITSPSTSAYDAVITNVKNYPILFPVSDCPVVVLSPKKEDVFGKFHSGRVETLSNIAEKTVMSMTEVYKLKARELVARFYTSICEPCYKLEYKPDTFPEEYRYAITSDGEKFLLYLRAIIRLQLINCGVETFVVEPCSRECTCCSQLPNGEKKYYSSYGNLHEIPGHENKGSNAAITEII
jgi:copper oxidase (laccase) domain-containing protein